MVTSTNGGNDTCWFFTFINKPARARLRDKLEWVTINFVIFCFEGVIVLFYLENHSIVLFSFLYLRK